MVKGKLQFSLRTPGKRRTMAPRCALRLLLLRRTNANHLKDTHASGAQLRLKCTLTGAPEEMAR